MYCKDLGDLSYLMQYKITLAWYYEDDLGDWTLYDPQPDDTEHTITGTVYFTIPAVTLENGYNEYYYTSSEDGHTEKIPFSDETTDLIIYEDTAINIYCICTQIDITLPLESFLWYATASSALTENDGSVSGYEMSSAAYAITNNSPSQYMLLDVSIENFAADTSGSNELALYEPDIELNFHLTDEGDYEIDAAAPVGKDMFNNTSYIDTYTKK